ncbi:hypothetical protein QTO34_006426 [Cnephaeus nilssonii]|uniref:V-SNARE coiled-coil homology domain-containing protein n=1 Tax=Cnephaeus nilssonii TaxID=3371016 RepID=A0AA40LHF7_CNENI|nr:hypothetical protein QTO34_006426 [Eptesicus nilssonii]
MTKREALQRFLYHKAFLLTPIWGHIPELSHRHSATLAADSGLCPHSPSPRQRYLEQVVPVAVLPSPREDGPSGKRAWCFQVLLQGSWQRCDGRARLGAGNELEQCQQEVKEVTRILISNCWNIVERDGKLSDLEQRSDQLRNKV